jgi:hypothetical protein
MASSSVNNESHVDMLNEHKEVEVERDSVTSGLSVGYFYSGDLIDFGLMIKVADMDLKRFHINIETQQFQIGKIYHHIPSMTRALWLGGISIKPAGNFSVSFSIGASMPYSHKIKECNEDTSSLDEYENTLKLNYGLASAGLFSGI